MGFEEGWLDKVEISRLKMNMQRFETAMQKAKENGEPTFMFDGEQYKTEPNKMVNQVQIQKTNKSETDYEKR